MKRDDFVFIIGFDGENAIVDKRSRFRYRGYHTRALADIGMFAAAYRSAVFDKDTEGLAYVLEKYNAVSSINYKEPADLEKVFGIQPPSDNIAGVRIV